MQMAAKGFLLDTLNHFDELWDDAKSQSGDASHWGMPTTEQRTIDWHWPVEKIDCMCRAFGKFGCFATFSNQQWVVFLVKTWKEAHDYEIGEVVHKTSTEMIVAASDGLVSVVYFSKAPEQ